MEGEQYPPTENDIFTYYPLQDSIRLAGSNHYYDLTSGDIVSEERIPIGYRKSSKSLNLCGSHRDMNRCFRYLNMAVSPNPSTLVLEKLARSLLEEYPAANVIDLVHKGIVDLVGKIVYKGPTAGGDSWHGIGTDVLLSAVHKYVRRGFAWKAQWCVIELLGFIEKLVSTKNPQPSLKAFATRVFNRVCVILSLEDVGIGNISIPLMVERMVRSQAAPGSDEQKAMYHQLVEVMCRSEKSRELSHIRTVYSYAYEDEVFREVYANIYEGVGDQGDLFKSFKEMFNSAGQERDRCFIPFFKAINEDRALALKMARYASLGLVASRPDYAELISVLEDWHKRYKFKESWMPAAQIVLISLRTIPFPSPPVAYSESTWYVSWYRNLYNPKAIRIDDYCIDMHTRKGKRQGKNAVDFCNEGALVLNESKLTTPIYAQIYDEFKVYKETGTKPPEAVETPVRRSTNVGGIKSQPIQRVDADEVMGEDVPRGQLLTSRYKVYTYFPYDGKTVYKGPFGWKKLGNVLARADVVELLGLGDHILVPRLGEDENGGVWLLYRNISAVPKSKWTVNMKTSSLQTTPVPVITSSLGVYQLKRDVVPFSDLLVVLFGPTFLYKYYFLMALLGAGDMGPWNAIWSGDIANSYIIDYDDDSHRKALPDPESVFAKRIGISREQMQTAFDTRRRDLYSFFETVIERKEDILEIIKRNGASIDLEANINMACGLFS